MVKEDLAPNLEGPELMELYDRLKIEYSDRLRAMFGPIIEELKRFSWYCSKPFEVEDGQYAIAVSRDQAHLSKNGEPDDLDVEISAALLESEEWEDVRGGLDFSLTITSYGGDKIGRFPSVTLDFDRKSNWAAISDYEEIEKRFKLIENVDPYHLVLMLQKMTKGKSAK